MAIRLGLNPSAIIDTGDGFRTFQCKEGRVGSIIAQRLEGGPVLEKRLPKGKKSNVPLQDPNAPTFGEKDRLLTGPWMNSDYATFEDVRAHYSALGPSTRHRIEFEGELLTISYPCGDEIEYRLSSDRVQQRALQAAKDRSWRYPPAEPAAPVFKVGPWEESIHETLEDVEAFWRKQFVNFDNVEVLDVQVYRIGKDEYAYVADKNTGKIWNLLLTAEKEAKNDEA